MGLQRFNPWPRLSTNVRSSVSCDGLPKLRTIFSISKGSSPLYFGQQKKTRLNTHFPFAKSAYLWLWEFISTFAQCLHYPETEPSRAILDPFRIAISLGSDQAFTGVDYDFTIALPRFRLPGKVNTDVSRLSVILQSFALPSAQRNSENRICIC